MSDRLRRLERIFQRHPLYFITACAFERRDVLANPDVHTRLVEFGKEGPAHRAWLGRKASSTTYSAAANLIQKNGITCVRTPSGQDW
jgi:hypothetical protein